MKWIHSLSLVLSRFHTDNVPLRTNYVIYVHSINLLSKSHSTFRPNHLTFLPAILAGRRQERPNVHPGAPGSFPASSPTRSQSPSYCTWQSWWLSWWQSSTQEISSTQRWLSEVGWELIQGRLVLNIIVIIIIIFRNHHNDYHHRSQCQGRGASLFQAVLCQVMWEDYMTIVGIW